MRIVLDARWIFEELSGIGLYTRQLISNLVEIDQDNEYVLLFDDGELLEREERETGSGEAANFTSEMLSYSVFSPASQLRMCGLLRRLKADVFHSPNYMIPFAAFPRRRCGCTACITTIHDLIPLLFPEYTPRALKTRFYPVFKSVMRQSVARADAVIVPSESTRRDVLEHLLPASQERMNLRVVYQGVSPEYRPSDEVQREARTILYVGRFDPYKNVGKVIEAYAALRKRGLEAKLRIIGSDDLRYPQARELAVGLGIDAEIDWCGYVDGDALLDAYRRAGVFVLPSRYEGFGLPVLEAMACGAPVVCGNRSSLPEVVGDAAITVDPDDVDAIAAAVESVITDEDRAKRMSGEGLERARIFSWRKTARNTLRVYESFRVNARGR